MSSKRNGSFTYQQVNVISAAINDRPNCLNLNQQGPEYFLLLYVHLESLIRLILRYSDTALKPNSRIRIDSVRTAFKYYQISKSDDSLRVLLDSKATKKGIRSARNLRNSLVHSWEKSAREEVTERASELNSTLFIVISAITEIVSVTDREKSQ